MKFRIKSLRLFLKNVYRSSPCPSNNSQVFRNITNYPAVKNVSKSINIFGQPTPDSHPHLLKPGELLPGFKLNEFKERRTTLGLNILSKDPKSSHAVLIPSSSIQYMTEKIPYIFRQNSDFRYLTGCLEPDSALLILISPNKTLETTLFVRAKSEHSELWEGPRTGVDNAPSFFGVDRAKLVSDLSSELLFLKKSLKKVIFWYDYSSPVNYIINDSVASFLSESGTKELVSVKSKLHELRLIKSFNEQVLLRESAEIASRGIESAMSVTEPGLTEHQLFATVDYYCRMNSAEHLAYPPVVAAGSNANIIHYIDNKQQIKDGDMILMDAGCELHGYCSDITRTWPANGRFTDPQRTLYDIVLSTQLDLIEKCSKQTVTLDQLFEDMCNWLGKRLKEAHVLTKYASNLKFNQIGFKLCPHHVGHYLGMDVHDTGTITRDIALQEGMLITIEPGIYVRNGCALTKPEFHDIGLRIEDNVLITSSGADVISNAVKTPDEVEKLCQGGR